MTRRDGLTINLRTVIILLILVNVPLWALAFLTVGQVETSVEAKIADDFRAITRKNAQTMNYAINHLVAEVATLAISPSVKEVVRKQNAGEARVIFWLMLLQPENLRGCEPWKNRVSNLPNRRFEATDRSRDLGAFLCCAGVTPQLRRTNHLSPGIQRHEAMLLATHPDCFYFGCFRSGLL